MIELIDSLVGVLIFPRDVTYWFHAHVMEGYLAGVEEPLAAGPRADPRLSFLNMKDCRVLDWASPGDPEVAVQALGRALNLGSLLAPPQPTRMCCVVCVSCG